MARKPALASAKATFLKALDSAENLCAAVSPYLQRDHDAISQKPLHPEQARRVVALAFLAAVSAWEEFIEFAFTRYLAGAVSPGGFRPVPRMGVAQSVRHSYEVLSGEPGFSPERRYLNWSPDETIRRARIVFISGEPFTSAFQQYRERLDDCLTIRHRVAHSSRKARQAFKKVAINLSGTPKPKLRQGYSVGELLISPANRGFGRFGGAHVSVFDAYLSLLRSMAERLVP